MGNAASRNAGTNSVLWGIAGLVSRSYMKKTLLLASLFMTGCASLNEGQHQTIYVPTSNGVEAQRVNTGPSPEKKKEGLDGPYAIDPNARALQADSDHLKYLGQISEPLFISGSQVEALFVDNRNKDQNFVSSGSICSIWAEHVDQLLDVGSLQYCTDNTHKSLIRK